MDVTRMTELELVDYLLRLAETPNSERDNASAEKAIAESYRRRGTVEGPCTNTRGLCTDFVSGSSVKDTQSLHMPIPARR